MTRHGRIALYSFAALLMFTVLAGLARNFHSRDQGRFEATVATVASADSATMQKLAKVEATTADGRTIVVVADRARKLAPGDRIIVSARATPWGQTWYALADKSN